MPYWQFYYHLVWATKYRVLIIDDEIADLINREFKAACNKYESIPHAFGFMPDHVHLVVSIPPKVAVSEYIGRVKAMSSLKINQLSETKDRARFGWQTEYSAHSFAARSLDSVIAYVNNQAKRHAENNLWSDYERLDSRPMVPTKKEISAPEGGRRGVSDGL
jgi:putative transposase